jgi:hypothetical protein
MAYVGEQRCLSLHGGDGYVGVGELKYRALVKFDHLHEEIWVHFNRGQLYALGLHWVRSLGGLPPR